MVGRLGGVIQNSYSCVLGEGVTRFMWAYILTRLHSLTSVFQFLVSFFSYSVWFCLQKFKFSLIQKRSVDQKRLFFSNKINFYRHETSYFDLKLFLPKQSQKAFSFNQIESQIHSIFQYDTLLSKNPVQRSAENKVYFIIFLFSKLFNVDIYRVCLILLFLLMLLNVITFAIS